jgi:hypothetical protein
MTSLRKKWAKRNTYFSPQIVPLKWLEWFSISVGQKGFSKLCKNREYGAPGITLHLSWPINRSSPDSVHNEFLDAFVRVWHRILLCTESSTTLSRIKYGQLCEMQDCNEVGCMWKKRQFSGRIYSVSDGYYYIIF